MKKLMSKGFQPVNKGSVLVEKGIYGGAAQIRYRSRVCLVTVELDVKQAKVNLLIHESPLTDALFLLVSKSDEVTTT